MHKGAPVHASPLLSSFLVSERSSHRSQALNRIQREYKQPTMDADGVPTLEHPSVQEYVARQAAMISHEKKSRSGGNLQSSYVT